MSDFFDGCGQAFEICHILRQMPRQTTILADAEVVVCRYNNVEGLHNSDRDGEFDERMWIIVVDFKVFKFQFEKWPGGNLQSRQLPRFALKLITQAIDMIEIDMRITHCMGENAGLQI